MSIFDKILKRNREAAEEPQKIAESAVNGFDVIENPVGTERLKEFDNILLRYQTGKKSLENRIIKNYRIWRDLKSKMDDKEERKKVDPKSAWLFNTIVNKHADAMDNFPAPNILPREESDRQEAKSLSSIIPVVLDQNDYEETYSDTWWDKLIAGTGVTGSFWNKNKLNGLGDIDIKDINILNIFWAPAITDLQDSRYVFHTVWVDNEVLEDAYPQLRNKLGGQYIYQAEIEHEDTVDNSDKTIVVDVYYKMIVDGKTVLHYCKYVGDTVLYATENDPDLRDRGLYDHGDYPFDFDPLFPLPDSPAGFGYIDIAYDTQYYIDKLNQAILKNSLAGALPRYFYRKDAGINVEEYANLNNELILYTGQPDNIIPIQTKGLDGIYVSVLEGKINEIKEVTGNRDIQTGGTTSGVTAASAIAAMQEAGSKLSRDASRASYRVYRKLILKVIELIRQFYDIPRSFRITGDNGAMMFTEYSNEGIVPQPQGEVDAMGNVISEFDVEVGYRLPLFDVEITAQKQSPYSKMAQNELALQLYQLGIFNPNNTDAALACLDMMDFDRKESIMQKIAQNGTLLQQLAMAQQRELQLAMIVDKHEGTNLAQQIAGEIMGNPVGATQIAGAPADVELDKGTGEAENTKRARQRTAEMTAPT